MSKKQWTYSEEYDFGAGRQSKDNAQRSLNLPEKGQSVNVSQVKQPPSQSKDTTQRSFVLPEKGQPVKKEDATPVTRPPPTFKFADMSNPYLFTLKRAYLNRDDSLPLWGFQIANVADGVVQVIQVAPGGPAAMAGAQKGAYIFSVCGKRIYEVGDAIPSLHAERKTLRLSTVSPRQPALDPNSFALPDPFKRKQNHVYLLARINPTEGHKVGTGIAENREGQVCITMTLEKSAGSEAGLKTGDHVLMVDEDRIKDKGQCQILVQDTKGEPFDMLIERSLVAYTPQPSSPAPVQSPQPSAAPAVPAQPPIQKWTPGEEYDFGAMKSSGYTAQSAPVQTPRQPAPSSPAPPPQAPAPPPKPFSSPSPSAAPPVRPRPPPPKPPGHGDPTQGIPDTPQDVVLLQSRARQAIQDVSSRTPTSRTGKPSEKKQVKKANVAKDVKSMKLRK